MEWCCNTRDFLWHRYAQAERADSLFAELARRKITKLIIDSLFFPERAMYWTRMAVRKARERGLEVVALSRRASIGYAAAADVEPALYDLQEWGRICGLTKLPLLRVELAGVLEVGAEILAARILSVLASTLQYGVRLLLWGGKLAGTDQLLEALRRVGPDVCSLSVPDQPLGETSLAWVGEIYDSSHGQARTGKALHTIRCADRAAPLQELDAFLASRKGALNG